MATTILTEHTPTINLSAVALAYVEQIDEMPTMYLVEKMCIELAQIERLTGDSEFSDTELRYAYLIASGEEVGFDDLPASLYPDC